MMHLTKTAIAYLATLKRRPTISVEQLQTILQAAEQPCYGPWLAFHEQFAGYVEPIGVDVAVWGIVHEHPQWLAPLQAGIDVEKDGVTFYVACADVHPSYSYQLDHLGEFLGFPAEHFTIHVERRAAGWNFGRSRVTEALHQSELRSAEFIERLAGADVLESASDKFFRYLQEADVLVIWDLDAAAPQRGWRRK